MYICTVLKNKNMQNKININKANSLTPAIINVRVVTYQVNWDNHRVRELSHVERTFNNPQELMEYATQLYAENETLRRNARKSKDSYYQAQFIETI